MKRANRIECRSGWTEQRHGKKKHRGWASCQQRNANFPVLSSLIFTGPGAVLADSCHLAPVRSPTATEYAAWGNTTEAQLCAALGHGSCDWAGAEGRWWFEDGDITAVGTHSSPRLSSEDVLATDVCGCMGVCRNWGVTTEFPHCSWLI